MGSSLAALDPCAMLPRMFIVAIHVRDPHEYRVARMGTLAHGSLRQDDRALANDKLDTMVAYAQSLSEAKDAHRAMRSPPPHLRN